ncbi:Tip attachment protein J [uncultured Caudovirales phage]|uniref:Tip attachment protein J n=1 Tax=uncultured Caudovirales phage TaxID=2100421 RepID=A0A6J5LTY0_9CAUD|nr:Tip attachment protein J [uncultured Caudovirales phage]
MGKVVRTVVSVAAIVAGVALAIPSGGSSLLAVKLGISGMAAAALSVGLSLASSFLRPSPRTPRSQLSRLNVSLDPNTPRKAVFGTTAMPLDLRYHEASGADQEFIDYIIAVAAHKVASIDEIWFEEKLAWSSSGGVTSTYAGYLTVQTRTEGTAANAITINSGTVWDSSCRLTGCAYVYLRIKRTGNVKKTESPLVQGLPSRITIVGEGAPLYDPRLDSTVPGGSGSHRANNQATWGTYAGTDDYDNPALQLLWFLLGWKINGKLSVGAGVPPERIDMQSFITAANICDENITLATGGTQKRYRTSGTASDQDDRMEAINAFLVCMNGTLRDNGGKLTLALLKNDLGDPVLELSDGDMLGEFAWDQTGGGLSQGNNIIRGRFIDPSNNSLYQLAEYPEVSLPSPDGIERVMTFDLPFVEDGRRAQRLAKQVLQRQQFRGQLSAEFSAKALGCDVGDIVLITLGALGFNEKPFRVISKEVRPDGRVPLSLLEESPLIYQWDRDDKAPVVARTPIVYNPLLNLMTQGDDAVLDVAVTKVRTFYSATAPTAEAIGDLWFDTDDEVLYRWDGTTWLNNVSDITSANQITFSEVDPFIIQANSAGVTTTTLPITRGIKVFRGGVEQTSGVTVGTVTATSGITASASVSSGAVTVSLSVANAVGYITVPIIFGGVTYPRLIVVNRTIAAPVVGGAAGSTSFTDQTWAQVSSTSFVAVTDANAQIQSDSSGRIRLQAIATYEGVGVAEIKTQYSANNSTWTDVATGTGSTASNDPFEPEPGFVSVGPTTVTGLAASTNYFVRLVARETNAAHNFSWSFPSFTADQP